MGNCFYNLYDKKKKERNDRDFDQIKRAEKGQSRRKKYHDSDSSSSFGSDDRPANERRSKKITRQKNGGLVVYNKKTVVGGDVIKVEGSKIVNITTGGRRSKGSSGRDTSRTNETPSFIFPNLRSSDQNSHSLPGCFLQIEDRRVFVLDQKHLLEVEKSVGQVCSGDCCGTCFRVGHNYVMTARHVLMDIVNNGIISLGPQRPTTFAALDSENVYINFDYLSNNIEGTRKFYLTSNVVFEDKDLDVAVVEIKPTADLPPPFRHFGQAKPNNKFTFVGHPFGEPKQLNQVDGLLAVSPQTKAEAVAWSRGISGTDDGFTGIDTSGRILFHCAFEKGGSGSPGIALVGRQAVVVTVLLHGYPEWYYDPYFDQGIKNRITNQQRIEQGVSMKDLYLKMHEVNRDLCNAIFGSASE